MKRLIIFLLLTLGFLVSYSQPVWIIDYNPRDDDGGYFMTSVDVQASLQKGKLNRLSFSAGHSLTEKQFLALSEKFQKALPPDFFKRLGADRAPGLKSTHVLKVKTSELAYGMIEGGKIKWFVQVVIAFEGTSWPAKIKDIEVRTGSEIIPEDSKKIIEQRRKSSEYDKAHPPPPPPPSVN
jgi:hypothetical protein